MDIHEARTHAARLLEVDESSLEASSSLTYAEGFAFHQPVRGGATLLVAHDGSALFAASGVSPERAVAEFREGRRSEPESFNAPVAQA